MIDPNKIFLKKEKSIKKKKIGWNESKHAFSSKKLGN